MKQDDFMKGAEAMSMVALNVLKEVLESNMGPLDPNSLQALIAEEFEQELLGRV